MTVFKRYGANCNNSTTLRGVCIENPNIKWDIGVPITYFVKLNRYKGRIMMEALNEAGDGSSPHAL